MKISQREAHQLRRRVRELEDELNLRTIQWTEEYPSWTTIGAERLTPITLAKIQVARKLKHAVMVVEKSDGIAIFLACELRGTK